jgi:GT2 family glycosyltransferase
MSLEDYRNKTKKQMEVLMVVTPKRAHLLKYSFSSLLIGSNKNFVKEVIVAPLGESEQLINALEWAKKKLEYYGIHLKIVYGCTSKDPLGYCRQLLLENAKGPFITIVDDDILFTPKYVENVMKAFYLGCDIVFGALRPPSFYLRNQMIRPSMSRYIIRSTTTYNELFLCGDAEHICDGIYEVKPRNLHNIIQCTQGLWGANMSFKLNILRALGGFKPLGYVRGMPIGGDDTELCVRAFLRGYKVCYSSRARLIHIVDPRKINKKYALLKYSTITYVYKDLQPKLEAETILGYIYSWLHELANIVRISKYPSKITDILFHLSIPIMNIAINRLLK